MNDTNPRADGPLLTPPDPPAPTRSGPSLLGVALALLVLGGLAAGGT